MEEERPSKKIEAEIKPREFYIVFPNNPKYPPFVLIEMNEEAKRIYENIIKVREVLE